jgi:hypothetical protein
MTPANLYRAKSVELAAEAKQELNPVCRSDLEWLALSYQRLAEQADHNQQTDIVYETPPMADQSKSVSRPQPAPQQRSKSDE